MSDGITKEWLKDQLNRWLEIKAASPSEHSHTDGMIMALSLALERLDEIEAEKPPTIKAEIATIIGSCDNDEIAAECVLNQVVEGMLVRAHRAGRSTSGHVSGHGWDGIERVYARRTIKEALGQ